MFSLFHNFVIHGDHSTTDCLVGFLEINLLGKLFLYNDNLLLLLLSLHCYYCYYYYYLFIVITLNTDKNRLTLAIKATQPMIALKLSSRTSNRVKTQRSHANEFIFPCIKFSGKILKMTCPAHLLLSL